MSENKSLKVKVQRFGSYLSGMVMPNIGAFIAWGLITALFIATGWAPNEHLAQLVDPMIKYLLPVLIGYTGGKLIYDTRGGVIASTVTMGLIVGSSIPMFLGAMIMGPFTAWLLKKFDGLVEGKIPAGFEMLINNFSSGILGGILAVCSLIIIGPAVEQLNNFMANGADLLISNSLLPLVSIFVEPAKVLFLNNAINHGVLGPIALDQVAEHGKSLLYLVEANPGPGLGILVAYTLFGKGTAKQTAPGAIIIHFLGGIHEIYFPYILMNPILLLAAISGGMVGVFTLSITNAGLVAAASPGSIFAILAMTERNSYIGVILSVILSATVSFIVSAVILRRSKDSEMSLETATQNVQSAKAQSKVQLTPSSIKKIIFACDAGMGSSAMGASVLRNKIKNAGLDIEVTNAAISQLPNDGDIIVTHVDLKDRVLDKRPGAHVITVTNFLSEGEYTDLVNSLKK